MHAWLSLILPDVPERPSLKDEEVATLIYNSCFVGTNLRCKYKKGNASFFSENISTIIILSNALTRVAIKRKMKLDVFCDVSQASLVRVLEMIIPLLRIAEELREEVKILDALQQWELKSNPGENLSREFQELLKNEDRIRTEIENKKDMVERLHLVMKNLYVDWERARGSYSITREIASEKLKPAFQSMELNHFLQIFLGKESENCNNEEVNISFASRKEN